MAGSIINKDEIKDEIRNEVRSWPLWAKLLAMVVIAVAGYYLRHASEHPQPVTITVPVAQAVAPPLVTEAGPSERTGPGKRLFLRLLRHKVAEKLRADGFNAVGGNPTPLSEAKIEALMANLDDATMMEVVAKTGLVGEGILDRLSALIDWILDHKDQIEKIVKFILMLLMAFA